MVDEGRWGGVWGKRGRSISCDRFSTWLWIEVKYLSFRFHSFEFINNNTIEGVG